MPQLLDPGDGTDRAVRSARMSHGNRTTAPGRHHHLTRRGRLVRGSRACSRRSPDASAKLVNGTAGARLGLHRSGCELSSTGSRRRVVFAATRCRSRRGVTLNGGLRFETVRGSASDGRPNRVSWKTVPARPAATSDLTDFWQLAAFVAVRPLRSSAAAARSRVRRSDGADGIVYRWNCGDLGRRSERDRSAGGALGSRHRRRSRFQRRRPGAEAGPHMDEMRSGFEARPQPVHVPAHRRDRALRIAPRRRRRRRRARVDVHDDRRARHGHRS